MPRTITPRYHLPTEHPGRPKVVVDEKIVFALARNRCTYDDMAAILGVSVMTLKRRYRKVVAEGNASCNLSVRQQWIKAADAGEAWAITMYAKQYLGFSEKLQTQTLDKNGDPIVPQATVFVFIPDDGRDTNRLPSADPQKLRLAQDRALSRMADLSDIPELDALEDFDPPALDPPDHMPGA